MQTIHKTDILKLFSAHNPFSYNLGLHVIPGKKSDAHVTICCHGYGHSNQIADIMHDYDIIQDHLVSFNFPDHDMDNTYNPVKSCFGSIHEILPLLYVIKLCVIGLKLSLINLYGFSAGGGAVINALAILNQEIYDQELAAIGISKANKKTMIQAIQNGLIILDCPLKSIEEIIETRGTSEEFMILAKRYAHNNMRPIDALNLLQGMRLNILVHFQMPDDILGNTLDKDFADRLCAINQGITTVTSGDNGGHNAFHAPLWRKYKQLLKS